jgi:hypothetical protein
MQREHRSEHQRVLVAVKVLGPELILGGDRLEQLVAEHQQRAEHAAFGVQAVRRNGGGGHGQARSRRTSTGSTR